MTLLDKLLDQIRAQGPMPFAAFMALALYDKEGGYYASRTQRTGWEGHFVTAPELSPAYGSLWARGITEIWESAGAPERFDLIEVGPGEAGFVQALLDTAGGKFRDALNVTLVERIPAAEERQRERLSAHPGIRWVGSITELPEIEVGTVFANEILDNLPVHVVEKRGTELLEVCVTENDGALAEVLLPPSSPHLPRFLARLSVDLPDGHRYEVPLAAEGFVRQIAVKMARGALIFVDYGDSAKALARRPDGTLAAYSRKGVDADPLDDPGAKDITAHANWTVVSRSSADAGFNPIGPIPQRDILNRLGADILDRSYRDMHEIALAAGEGARAIRALSRRHALASLLDPGGLGGLQVLVALRGVDTPAFTTD